MIRQALHARGGLFPRARCFAIFPSVRAHAGIRPVGQHRAFYVFYRLRFDHDDGGSSYGTTSRGSRSSYGTTSTSGNYHDISSTSSTGLGGFKSSLAALGDESYSSPHTGPLLDSIITKRKIDTEASDLTDAKKSGNINPAILGELRSIRARTQALETKVDTINDGIKGFKVELHALNDGFEDLNTKLKAVIEDIESAPQRSTAAPKKSRWKEYYSKWDSSRKRGFQPQQLVRFWECAFWTLICVSAVAAAFDINEARSARLRAQLDREVAAEVARIRGKSG